MQPTTSLISIVWRFIPLVAGIALLYFVSTLFSVDELKSIAAEHRIGGAVLFGVLMFSTTVVAPLTSLPLVPVLAPFLGPFTTGLACYIGWTFGAILAFWIGRRFGRPFVARFVSLETFARYESYIRPEMSFFYITVLHMVIPVDIFSYVLGVCTSVSLRVYTLATLAGILWFSFAFAYMGSAVTQGDYVLFTGIGVASILIMYLSWRYLRSQKK